MVNRSSSPTLHRLGAVAEVCAVFVAGSFLANLLFAWAGIKGHPLAALLTEAPDYLAISWELAKALLLQYAGWFALAGVFVWIQWPAIRSEGSAHRPLGLLLGIGILGWALGDLPNKLVWIVDAEFDLGTSVAWREALISADPTPQWWVLMAVGSFALVPVLEEWFWRGYVQRRLHASFSAPTAIIAAALMFTLSHSQYHQLDAYHGATILAVFCSALVLGWLYHVTASLWPPILMHALLNVPTQGAWTYGVVALMLVLLVVFRTRLKAAIGELRTSLADWRPGAMDATVIFALALLMIAVPRVPGLVLWLGLGLLPMALALAVLWRRRHSRPDFSASRSPY